MLLPTLTLTQFAFFCLSCAHSIFILDVSEYYSSSFMAYSLNVLQGKSSLPWMNLDITGRAKRLRQSDKLNRTTVSLSLIDSSLHRSWRYLTSLGNISETSTKYRRTTHFTTKDSARVDKLIRRAGSAVWILRWILVTVRQKRTLDKLLAIMDDSSHPLHTFISAQRVVFSNMLLLAQE